MNKELQNINEQIIFDNFRYNLCLNDEQIKYIMDNVQLFATIIHKDVSIDMEDKIDELEDEIYSKEQIIEDLKNKIVVLSNNKNGK